MAINPNNPAHMREYLRFAVEFEKYVYIWTNAMNDANQRMQYLYNERKQLKNTRDSTQSSLMSLQSRNERRLRQKEQEVAHCKKRAKTSLRVLLVLMLLLFALGAVIGVIMKNQRVDFIIPDVWIIPILGLTVMVVGSIFTGILPICLIIHFSNKAKATQLEQEARSIASGNSQRRQEIILLNAEKQTESDQEQNSIAETIIAQKQEEIFQALQVAKKNLAQLYAENVLPQKYRSLECVATLYEYLSTGRCNIIQGHGGIYDTYEVERIEIEKLHQLVQINERLSRIEDYQRQIYLEMQQANRTLSGIRSSLKEIEKTNAQIATNTAISAAANQQTAAATQWMAWNAWANGY